MFTCVDGSFRTRCERTYSVVHFTTVDTAKDDTPHGLVPFAGAVVGEVTTVLTDTEELETVPLLIE